MRTFSFLGGLLIALSLLMPAGSAQAQTGTYTLNPGDKIQISVWREDALTRELVVLPDGTIGFPLVGNIKVAGSTPAQAEGLIEAELKKSIKSPQATVVVTSVDGNRVYIIGKVRTPGSFTLQSRMSVPQLIALAGGFADFAKESKVAILRQAGSDSFERIGVNLSKLLDGDENSLSAQQLLKAGDLVVVP